MLQVTVPPQDEAIGPALAELLSNSDSATAARNALEAARRTTAVTLFLRQFRSPLVLILIGAAIALVASGIEVAMALGLLHLSVAHLPLGILLGLALAVPGVLAWLRSSAKPATSAAVIVAFVGAIQVASALGRL